MEIDYLTTGWEKSDVFAAAQLFRSHAFQGHGGTPPPEERVSRNPVQPVCGVRAEADR